MNAKNEIIRDLNRQIEGYQEECKNLRQEIYDNNLDLEIKSLEILRLTDVNELQHGSWMLCDQINKEEVGKLNAKIAGMSAERLIADKIVVCAREYADAVESWSPVQKLIARLFRL